MKLVLHFLGFILLASSCATLPKGSPDNIPTAPNYKNLASWAAHPDKQDKADLVPGVTLATDQNDLEADVFFVHPTTYTSKPINDSWNAPTDNKKLNDATDGSTIQYQASIFNQAGRIFAPRYRQVHLKAYYTADKVLAKKVFGLAYEDVKTAFNYYLKHYNNGRPFILASHSQGTTHTARLIKEMIDEKALKIQMIAAYLIGMPIPKDIYKSINPCQSADETGCYISWRTYKKGHIPDDTALGSSITVHNPLSWLTDDAYVPKEMNKGAILRNFNKVYLSAADAQINNGILWASKPKFPFSFLFTRKNYHVADLNFYYMNVRENAQHRVQKYLADR